VHVSLQPPHVTSYGVCVLVLVRPACGRMRSGVVTGPLTDARPQSTRRRRTTPARADDTQPTPSTHDDNNDDEAERLTTDTTMAERCRKEDRHVSPVPTTPMIVSPSLASGTEAAHLVASDTAASASSLGGATVTMSRKRMRSTSEDSDIRSQTRARGVTTVRRQLTPTLVLPYSLYLCSMNVSVPMAVAQRSRSRPV
jgi:hypothetical protein